MYSSTANSQLQLQHSHQGISSLSVQQQQHQQSSYQYHHPTPPYYSQSEVFQNYSKGPSPVQHQQHILPSQQKYLATPSSSYPQPTVSVTSINCPPLGSQQLPIQQQLYQFPDKQSTVAPLAINTKIVAQSNNGSSSSSMSSPSTRKSQAHSIPQLAEFAAHMVCYLLYGPRRQQSHNQCTGTPPSSIPSSPMPGHVSSTCPCDICNRVSPHSPERSSNVPTSVYQRPTHRRVVSESEIVQPKPMFRKFCLDVLSATLLSPSVILLSLKYIQQLMKNLKESNKIVNTGDGAEYRFFTGALILANKFLDDNTFTNKTWADITGMKIKDVNHLEMQFLNGIDFRLFTSPQSYSEWLASLTQFTSVYMPSQHNVASHHQAVAAQSPISPMDTTTMFPEPTTVRQSTSGTESRQIAQYIDSVRQLQQKSATTNSRYQRVPSQQFASLPHPTHGLHNSQQHSNAYQQETQESIHRKRSAVIAFDDAMDRSPGYDVGSLPHPNHAPVRRPSHKRYSSSSSLSNMVGMTTQDSLHYNGPSPSMSQQQRYQHRSNRASSGSLSLPFRGHHQRSVSGGYYIDMAGYASNYKESSHPNLPMPNTLSRPGVHPLDKDQEMGHRPPSRTESYHSVPHQMHYGSISSSSGNRSQPYHPSTPPQYSPNRYESSCQSMGCGSNMDAATPNFNVDPHLWSPLDSLKLYNITTQAAKRVVAQSKALSSSANTLHMYYPTTLA